MTTVGVLIGSLSADSYSRRVANYFVSLPSNLTFIELKYSILPFYNPDLERQPPAEWQAFRQAVDQVDALLIVTQEYNYSIPGGLKNALDVLSVPTPHDHLAGKPVLAITDSAGEKGGIIANSHLHQILRYLRMKVMNCTIAIGNVQSVFKDGQIHDAVLAKQLRQDVHDFERFIVASNLPQEACIDLTTHFSYQPGELVLRTDDGKKAAKISINCATKKVIEIEEVSVAKQYRGRGLANKIMTMLMWLVEGADYQVKVSCQFAEHYFITHPQFKNLLV